MSPIFTQNIMTVFIFHVTTDASKCVEGLGEPPSSRNYPPPPNFLPKLFCQNDRKPFFCVWQQSKMDEIFDIKQFTQLKRAVPFCAQFINWINLTSSLHISVLQTLPLTLSSTKAFKTDQLFFSSENHHRQCRIKTPPHVCLKQQACFQSVVLCKLMNRQPVEDTQKRATLVNSCCPRHLKSITLTFKTDKNEEEK